MALKELTLKDWFYVIRKELLSGLMLGLILGTVGLLRIVIWQTAGFYDYGDHWLQLGFTIFFFSYWSSFMGGVLLAAL